MLAVYAAHQQLIGSLPLSMVFDAPDGFMNCMKLWKISMFIFVLRRKKLQVVNLLQSKPKNAMPVPFMQQDYAS